MGANYSVLLVDADPCAALRAAAETNGAPLLIARSGHEARRAIADAKLNLAAILLNPVITSPGSIPLIALAHRRRPGTPVFATTSASSTVIHFHQEHINRLALSASIPSPERVEDIRNLVSPEILAFEGTASYRADESLRLTDGRATPQGRDAAYVPVPAADLLSGVISPFDIYVRLPSGKYLKILNARSVLAPERVLSYIEKGVTHFYMSRASHERCLGYCDLLARALLKEKQLSVPIKISHTLSRGQALIESVRDEGFRAEHIEYAEAFIGETYALVGELKLQDEATVRDFLEDVRSSACEHAVATTLVTSLLTLPMQIETRSAVRSVGLAALFHDIGLFIMKRKFETEDVTRMSPEDLGAFQEHPAIGATFLMRFEGIDEAVTIAVAKHHERRDNRGFPQVSGSNELNRVAEIVGIADEFVQLLGTGRPIPEVFREMSDRIFDGFSFPVIEAFRKVFVQPSPPRAAAKTARASQKRAAGDGPTGEISKLIQPLKARG